MSVYTLIFYFFGLMMIASALYAVISTNLVRSVFSLFLTFFSVAGILVFTRADYLAISQLMIYVGGILVVMLFGIMLSDKNVLELVGREGRRAIAASVLNRILGAGLALFLFAMLACVFLDEGWKSTVSEFQQAEPIRSTGFMMMTTYLLPFEMISLLLLMALIGAAYIARKPKHNR